MQRWYEETEKHTFRGMETPGGAGGGLPPRVPDLVAQKRTETIGTPTEMPAFWYLTGPGRRSKESISFS